MNELRHVDAALSVLGKFGGGSNSTKPKHTMSASARKRMSLAQKARWAKAKESSAETKAHDFSSRQKRIAAAQRATVGEDQGGEEVGCQRSLSRVRVIAFAAADSRDSSRSEHSLGVENRFHVDVEGFQIAGHLSQAAYRLDDTV